MSTRSRTSRISGGYTLVEAAAMCAVLGILLTSILVAMTGTQQAFVDNQVLSHAQLRTQHAMSRIVALAGPSLTSDATFSSLKPATGVNAHCLRFRRVLSIDTTTGTVVYDAIPTFIYGSDSGVSPCRGLIIGRGATLADVHTAGAGMDGALGTADDDASAFIGGEPVVELLIPDAFVPVAGDMFTVDISPAPVGRLLTFTIRINARDQNGIPLLTNDIVLTESVALRQ